MRPGIPRRKHHGSSWKSFSLLLSAWLVACSSLAFAQEPSNIPPRQDYAQVAEALKLFIEGQMSLSGIPGLSIAIVDDQKIVWAQGFGMADPKQKIPATGETVYRIGSVSKLFTDIGIMQRVERGEINLDAADTT